MDEVIVCSGCCVEACVLFVVDGDDVMYRNIVGKVFIQSKEEIVVPCFGYVGMKEKLCGMNLSVGAATAYDSNVCFENLA